MLPFPQQPAVVAPADALPRSEDLPGAAVYEPLFDGHRALLFVERGACRIQSRRGVDITSAFPEIAEAAVEWLPGGVVIDGEIVIWGNGRADFGEFHRRLLGHSGVASLHGATVSFVAFDVLAGAGMDLRASPFRVRRHALEMLLDDALPPLHVVPQTRERAQAHSWLTSYAESRVGIVGVVAKGMGTPYRSGAAAWHRVCVQESTEVVVWGVVGELGLPTHLVLAAPDGRGGLRRAGWTTRLSAREGELLGQVLVRPRSPHPWPEARSTADLPGWVEVTEALHLTEPDLVVEVATATGAASAFMRQRPDLSIEDLDR